MKAAAFSLVVLTLNVAGPKRVHQGWPTKRDAVASRLKAESSDAAAFQEVWRSADLDDLGQAAGHPHRVLDAGLGVAVTSRLPIESSASRDLGGGYGVIRARLKTPKGEADVYSARLEPGDGAAAARRLGQMFRLAEFVRAESSTRPFVLLGDLGAAADEKDSTLLLDLLEARDLCVSHGDEMCGRTYGDRRVDYALIPYSSRPPRQNARAAFTDLPADGDEPPAPARFGLRAVLDERFPALKPSALPPGRDEALAAIAAALDAGIADADRLYSESAWAPLLGARQAARSQDEVLSLMSLQEEIRTALMRDAKSGARAPKTED